MTKVLGKIESLDIRLEDGRFGLEIHFSLDGGSSGVSDTTNMTWSPSKVTPDKNHNWTEKDRDIEMLRIFKKADELMYKSKKQTLQDIVDIPVEVTLDGNMFKSFRILTEVL